MNTAAQTFQAVQRPQDCFDWLSQEDVARHAMAAYSMARAGLIPPAGTRFMQDGAPWADRENFGDNLAYAFDLRVKAEGFHLGVNPEWAREAIELLKWQDNPKVSISLAVGEGAP